MANNTKTETTVLPVTSPALKTSTQGTTTELATTRKTEIISISTEGDTTPPPNTTVTSLPSSTSNTTKGYPNEPNGNDSSSNNIGGIVGGCVGSATAVLVILVIAIVLVRRKRRSRRESNIPKSTLPDKDFLDSYHMERAVQHHQANQPSESDNGYVNVNRHGEADENTDPAVGHDGYLKKTKNFFGKHKKHKKDKKRSKAGAKRADSMPNNYAPPPPTNSTGYSVGRVADGSIDFDENAIETHDDSAYVNIQHSEKQGRAVLGGVHVPIQGNKSKEQSNNKIGKKVKKELQNSNTDQTNHPVQPETEQQEFYENVEGGNSYYNLKAGEQDNDPVRLSTYENVDTKKTDSPLQQDDVYENP